jgi:hypothetical protein
MFDSIQLKGTPLPVAPLLDLADSHSPLLYDSGDPSGPFILPTREELISQLKSWSRAKGSPTARNAVKILNDKPSLPTGEGLRNNFLISLAGYLAHLYPDHKELSSIFDGKGWAYFNSDGKYPIDHFESMIKRMQKKHAAELLEEQRQQIAAATKGARDYPLTDEERRDLLEQYGEDWHRLAILIHNKDLYFLKPDGTYDQDPIIKDNVFVAARDRLAVFGSEIEFAWQSPSGLKEKNLRHFLNDYATVIRDVVFDLKIDDGYYDTDIGILFLPAGAPRVEPRYCEDVQQWLEHFDDHLIDYIAAVPQFDKMLPALVLTGVGGSGKTILAKGLGMMFGSDPLDAEVAFSTFNGSALIKQPIILMDEKVNNAYRKEGTTLIRRFLTCSSRRLDEKYRSRINLEGFPRLIIAANNLEVLSTDEEMSKDDREAFAERLIHIDLSPGKDYLDQQPIHARWLLEQRLAGHLLWLAENREIQHLGRRFYVASNHTRLHDGLASKSGCAADVAYWLLSFVSNPKPARHLPIQFEKSKLRVNSAALVEGWEIYLRHHKSPAPSQISRAIKSLAKSRQKITTNGTGKRVDAYEIDPLLLRSANDTYRILEDFAIKFHL